MYTISMGTHPNIEEPDGRHTFQGALNSVEWLYHNHFAEAGSAFRWVIISDPNGRIYRRWTDEDGHETF